MTALRTAIATGLGGMAGFLLGGPVGLVAGSLAGFATSQGLSKSGKLPTGKQRASDPPTPLHLPESGPSRDAFILDAIKNGQFAVQWAAVQSNANGHTATFLMMRDALKINGVRINVGAKVEQLIADQLNCLLMTARLSDLLYMSRNVSLPPMPMPITTSTVNMILHSSRIDAALAQQGITDTSKVGVIETVGKHWIIDNDLLKHPGRACNYGWQFEGTYGGSAWGSSVTPPLRAIQDRGFAHGLGQDDYSQICKLVFKVCNVDGKQRELTEVLQDPELAPLASHQGPLKVLRQPGV